jgi:hypothetical protein
MAIITTVTDEPTGAYVDSLPILLPKVGVAGAGYRWAARTLTAANGTAVTSWPSTNGTLLTAASSTVAPVVATSAVGSVKCLSFDGVNDLMSLAALTAQRSISLVMRVTATNGTNTGIWSDTADDISLIRNSSNNWGAFAPGAGAAAGGSETTSLWHQVSIKLSASAISIYIDGTFLATGTSTGGALSSLKLGFGGGVAGKFEVAEIITWPAELIGADFTAVQTELRKVYTTLP